jgi:hypothetical protein
MPALTLPRTTEYATFGCCTYREQCETFQATGIEAEEPLGDLCEEGFVDLLPPIFLGLADCPGCGGPAEVLEVLVAVNT